MSPHTPSPHLLHDHLGASTPEPDQPPVVTQVSPLPQPQVWAQVVQPGLVELSWRESGGGPQLYPGLGPGLGHPHLLLGDQAPAPVADQGHGAEVRRGEVAQDGHHHLGGQVQQARHREEASCHSVMASCDPHRVYSGVYSTTPVRCFPLVVIPAGGANHSSLATGTDRLAVL